MIRAFATPLACVALLVVTEIGAFSANRWAGGATPDELEHLLPERMVARMGSGRFRHGSDVRFTAFTPDGKQLVSQSTDLVVHVWDPITGQELRRFTLAGNPHYNGSIPALAPDGKVLASGSMVGPGAHAIYLWDMVTGKQLRQFKSNESVDEVVFAPDGKTLATRSRTFNAANAVTLWETATGKQIRRIQTTAGAVAHNLAFSPDGQMVVSATFGTIYMWDPSNGKKLRQFKGAEGIIQSLQFTPDGRALAGQVDGTVLVWDTATGKELHQLAASDKGGITSLVITASGRKLICRETGRLRFLDLATGKEAPAVALPPMGIQSPAIALTADEKTIALPAGNSIHLCDLATGKPRHPFGGHRGGIESVIWSADGKALLSRDGAGSLRRWEPLTGKEINASVIPATGDLGLKWCIHRSALSADGSRLAFVPSASQAVRFWDVLAGKQSSEIPARPGTFISTICFAPDGRTLASLNTNYPANDDGLPETGQVRLWEVGTGKEFRHLGNLKLERGLQLRGTLRFSPDGRLLAAAGERAIGLWHTAAGREWWQVQVEKERASILHSTALAFSPDGRTLATGHVDRTISLWEVASGRERLRFKTPKHRTRALSFSPDGRALATAGDDGSVHVWDAAVGREIARYSGHQAMVTAIAFSPDGTKLASGSADTTTIVWDIVTVRDKARPQYAALNAEQVKLLWNDLRSEDARKAFQAMRTLHGDPKTAVAALDRHLGPVAEEQAKVARLIADLNSKQFAARERAATGLEDLGDLAELALKKVLQGKPPLETQQRVERLLAKLAVPCASGGPLRQLRAIEFLERLGTPEARQLLAKVAKGAAGARLTKEAAASLARLGK